MANDKKEPKKPGDAASGRSKRPTTIELKATEIRPEPASGEAGSAAPPPPPHPEQPEPAHQDTERTADAGSRDYLRSAYERLPQDWPWPAIGVGVAAAIVFFAVGLGAGHLLFGSGASQQTAPAASVAASPELLARLDKLEAASAAPAKEDPQVAARIAKLEAASAAPPKDDPQLQARLAKIEASVNAPRVPDAQVVARIAAAEAAVKTFADMVAAREKRSDEIAALARDAGGQASRALTAAEAAQKSRAASTESRADIDALVTRLAALEQAARTSQAELARRMAADDTKGRLAIAAVALRDSVEGGMPFAAELTAVKSLSGNADAVAALEPFAASGVPGADTLGRELAGLMPSLWKAARKDEPQTGTFLERLQANAEKVVRIRPAGDAAGDDPASVKARIESRASNADIRGALAELSKLPPDARAPAQAWIKKAEARNAAIAAARSLSQAALAALTKPGS